MRNTTIAARSASWLLVAVAVSTLAAAMVDSVREGYVWMGGLLFIGIASMTPSFIGVLVTRRLRNSVRVWIWLSGALIATLPMLGIWIIAALKPVPRQYVGAGQMHIFLLPVVHVVTSIPIYLLAGSADWAYRKSLEQKD